MWEEGFYFSEQYFRIVWVIKLEEQADVRLEYDL
jgi:hypothetical protein